MSHDNKHILVLELVQGTLLSNSRLLEGLSFQEITRVAVQLSAALEELAGANVLHSDIKPNNVILQADQIKIFDFNVSQKLSEFNFKFLGGTMPFAAPEVMVLKNFSIITCKADVWSFGVFLYYLLKRSLPFWQEDKSKLKKYIRLRKSIKTQLKLEGVQNKILDQMEYLLRHCIHYRVKERFAADQVHKFLNLILSSPEL